jgi:hypothetical protein
MVNYPLYPPQNEDVVGFARTWWHLRQAGAGNGVLIDSNDPNGMKVTRASASAVNVAAGHYANRGIWKAYAGATPAIESIPAASEGYHRYDSICVKLSDNTIVRVAGTEAVPDNATDFLENFTPLPADLNSTDYIELAILCVDENGIRSTDNGTYSVGGVCDTRPPFVFGLDDDTLTISADGKLASQGGVRKAVVAVPFDDADGKVTLLTMPANGFIRFAGKVVGTAYDDGSVTVGVEGDESNLMEAAWVDAQGSTNDTYTPNKYYASGTVIKAFITPGSATQGSITFIIEYVTV